MIAVFIWFLTRQVKGAGMQAFTFGQSKARIIPPNDKKQRVTFKDVAGAKEAKEEGLKNVRAIVGNIEKNGGTNLANESVDLCLMTNVAFALENKKEAILEAKRIIKKKGRMLFIEWSDSFGGIGPHSDHVFKEDEAKKLFEEVGLDFVQNIDAGEHHYGLIYRKV